MFVRRVMYVFSTLIVLVLICNEYGYSQTQAPPSGLLGRWEPVSKRSNNGVYLSCIAIEFGCTAMDGTVHLTGHGNRGPVNLGRLSCKYWQITPIKAWANSTKLLVGEWRGNWTFQHDPQNDIIVLEYSQPRSIRTSIWHFRRVSFGYPCNPPPRREMRNNDGWKGDRTPGRPRPSENQDNGRDSRSERSSSTKGIKISRIYRDGLPDRFSNQQKVTIEGRDFPMNVQLWIDGKQARYFGVKWVSPDKLTTTVVAPGRHETNHYFQLKNPDTGEMSNTVTLYY